MIHWHFEDKERPRKSLMKIAYCDQDPIGFIDGRKDGPFTFTSVDPRFRDGESGRMRLLVDRLERQERGFKGKQSMLDEAIAGVQNLGITVPTTENPTPSSTLYVDRMNVPEFGNMSDGDLVVEYLEDILHSRKVWEELNKRNPTLAELVQK